MTFDEQIAAFRAQTVGLPLTQKQFDANCQGMADIILAEIERRTVEILVAQIKETNS